MSNNDLIARLYAIYCEGRHVTTDSREVRPWSLFFAFKGEHYDGNAYARQALEQGAAMCVVSDHQYEGQVGMVVVDNVLEVLQQLAAYSRQRLQIPIIGITGTNGKTTTKELIAAVLSRRYRTSATHGNLNNHLGVPLTLLSISDDCEVAIVEMGANHPGEIEALCHIADPEYGLITNVGRAHLEGFGGFEGVISTKTELYRHLAGRQGTAFVDADNEILIEQIERLATLPGLPSAIPAMAPATPAFIPSVLDKGMLSVATYGEGENAAIRGSLIASNPYMQFYFEVGDNVYRVASHLLGDYNFHNAMAAVAVGLHFGVDPFDIKQAIEEYQPTNNRSELRQTAHNTLYLDCYNANPTSMGAALESFAKMEAAHKAVILGGMKELGRESHHEHQALSDRLSAMSLDKIYLVGAEFANVQLPSGALLFADAAELKAYLQANPLQEATVLVKGSNSNRLWTLIEDL